MISLWLVFTLLSLAACAFIAWPLCFAKPTLKMPSREINKTWYQEQLQELEKAFANQQLSRESFEKNTLQLQKDYLLMLDDHQSFSLTPLRLIALLLAIILVAAAAFTYQKIGAWRALKTLYHQQQTLKNSDAEINALGGEAGVIEKLKQRLKTSPNEVQGWYLLGRIYFSQNKYTAAARSFEKAAALAPKRVDIATEFAEASYLSQLKNDQLQAHARLQAALALDPTNPVALNLSALMLYHRGKYQEALAIWQTLLTQAPEGSDAAKALQSAIQQVNRKINRVPSPSKTADEAVAQ